MAHLRGPHSATLCAPRVPRAAFRLACTRQGTAQRLGMITMLPLEAKHSQAIREPGDLSSVALGRLVRFRKLLVFQFGRFGRF